MSLKTNLCLLRNSSISRNQKSIPTSCRSLVTSAVLPSSSSFVRCISSLKLLSRATCAFSSSHCSLRATADATAAAFAFTLRFKLTTSDCNLVGYGRTQQARASNNTRAETQREATKRDTTRRRNIKKRTESCCGMPHDLINYVFSMKMLTFQAERLFLPAVAQHWLHGPPVLRPVRLLPCASPGDR